MKKRRRINPAKALRARPSPADMLRFLAKVEQEATPTRPRMGPCWIWTAHKDSRGYGQFSFRGKSLWAHRVSYAIFKKSIPDLFEIDHRCHNPQCVNPYHLAKKTQSANVAESNKTRARQAAGVDEAPF